MGYSPQFNFKAPGGLRSKKTGLWVPGQRFPLRQARLPGSFQSPIRADNPSFSRPSQQGASTTTAPEAGGEGMGLVPSLMLAPTAYKGFQWAGESLGLTGTRAATAGEIAANPASSDSFNAFGNPGEDVPLYQEGEAAPIFGPGNGIPELNIPISEVPAGLGYIPEATESGAYLMGEAAPLATNALDLGGVTAASLAETGQGIGGLTAELVANSAAGQGISGLTAELAEKSASQLAGTAVASGATNSAPLIGAAIRLGTGIASGADAGTIALNVLLPGYVILEGLFS